MSGDAGLLAPLIKGKNLLLDQHDLLVVLAIVRYPAREDDFMVHIYDKKPSQSNASRHEAEPLS